MVSPLISRNQLSKPLALTEIISNFSGHTVLPSGHTRPTRTTSKLRGRPPDRSTDVLTPTPIPTIHLSRMRPFPNLPSGGLATMHDQRPPDPAL
jgi:hypothetical protein